jgi:LysR family transcriptional regulator, glycine cleavage system transcriptional activator
MHRHKGSLKREDLTIHVNFTYIFGMSGRRIPTLNALRAFEAAGRLGSVTRAASELSVTHAAVSHQVRVLEEWLGKPVFTRQHRRIVLTQAGATLLPALSGAFDRVAEAIDAIVEDGGRAPSLTISAVPSIAYRWLVPRLAGFTSAHPEIAIRLEHSQRLIDFTSEDIDCALRYGAGSWPGLEAIRLLSGAAVAMASPNLLERHGISLSDLPLPPERIAALPTMHEEAHLDWRHWLDAAGASSIPVPSGAILQEAGTVLTGAIAGRAVVIGRRALAQEELHHGLLVELSPVEIATDMGYDLVYPIARREDATLAIFRDWLVAEAVG